MKIIENNIMLYTISHYDTKILFWMEHLLCNKLKDYSSNITLMFFRTFIIKIKYLCFTEPATFFIRTVTYNLKNQYLVTES